MTKISSFVACCTGLPPPSSGAERPIVPTLGARGSGFSLLLSGLGLLVGPGLLVGCSNQDAQRSLPPERVAIADSQAPIYDDGQTTMYESKLPVQLPILEPDRNSMRTLSETVVDPYGRQPWVLAEDVEVQISWVISNLDAETHNVHLLVDPWNEFGRYWPGLTLVDEDAGEYLPNLSGYDRFIEVPGLDDERSSRVDGVITFNNIREMAIDFATVINIIEYPPPQADDSEYGPITYANHAFDIHNSSERDPFVDPYIPQVIAGLTGFDVGLRSYEPANIALEVLIEVVDTGNQRVVEEGSPAPILAMPERQYTLGE